MCLVLITKESENYLQNILMTFPMFPFVDNRRGMSWELSYFKHQCGISLDKVRQDLGTRNITFPQ